MDPLRTLLKQIALNFGFCKGGGVKGGSKIAIPKIQICSPVKVSEAQRGAGRSSSFRKL